MILSIPFLASRLEQFDPTIVTAGFGVEASLFNRQDIVDATIWAQVCANVREVALRFRPPSFTFHFPVNDCDYIEDSRIRDRLFEALDLVAVAGMDGLVLHSNRVFSTGEWLRRDITRERARFAEFVTDLRRRVRGAPFWIGLENMPIQGNDARELDPLLVFPRDFDGICGDNVGVTFDFCHFSYTVHVTRRLVGGHLDSRDNLSRRINAEDWFDFEHIASHIVHWHFSAFRSSGASMCTEGMTPWESTVSEAIYREAFLRMARIRRAKAVTLEIQEKDYTRRRTVFEVAAWCREVIQ